MIELLYQALLSCLYRCLNVSNRFIQHSVNDKVLPILLLIASCSTQSEKTKSTQSDTAKAVKSFKQKVISDSAKVFRYTELQINDKEVSYLHKNDKTLTLYYNTIACQCPQWSEIKFNENAKERLYYLERASEKLIDADSLFDGEHLPIQIEVTGQIVSENCYPKGFHPTKGAEAGKVFRYTKIKVIKKNLLTKTF